MQPLILIGISNIYRKVNMTVSQILVRATKFPMQGIKYGNYFNHESFHQIFLMG